MAAANPFFIVLQRTSNSQHCCHARIQPLFTRSKQCAAQQVRQYQQGARSLDEQRQAFQIRRPFADVRKQESRSYRPTSDHQPPFEQQQQQQQQPQRPPRPPYQQRPQQGHDRLSSRPLQQDGPQHTRREYPSARQNPFPDRAPIAADSSNPQHSRPRPQAQRPPPGPRDDPQMKHLKANFILDEDIPGQTVRIKGSEGLSDFQPLRIALMTLDRTEQVLHQLAAPNDQNQYSVVEVTTRAALQERIDRKREVEEAQAKSQRASKPKSIEVNWAISGHDLERAITQMKGFLEKGKKVEILLANKKRQRKATPEEAKGVVDEIRKAIGELNGFKEIRPFEGHIGGQALMTVGKS